MAFFDGFVLDYVDLGDATLRVRHGGSGPPVALLHGHPRTHATWNRVAPLLTARHTVVCPDLRGYGESSKTPPYTKRAMARDVLRLMQLFGHERFAVVGHDRGSYVAHRLAVDHPAAVEKLVFMGAVPLGEAVARADARFALAWWHWFFFAQREKPAERVISGDPDGWYRVSPEYMGDEAFADLQRALHDPEVVHAMLEDYRAGMHEDAEADLADQAAGRHVQCPTLVLWARRDDAEELYGDLLPIWRTWAADVKVAAIDSGHHMAEEAPEELASVLVEFLARKPRRRAAPGVESPERTSSKEGT
jgi:haloacetate dehalogenase